MTKITKYEKGADQVNSGQCDHCPVQRAAEQPGGPGQDHVQGARPHQRSHLPQNQNEGEEVFLEKRTL